MLNNVPTQINRAARMVTLRHPNAIDCTVWRKQINRVSTATPATFGGLPTIGEMGVLDGDDEADFEFTELGDARIVFVGQFTAQNANWLDDDTAINYQDQPVEALIECEVEPGDPAFFLPDKNDMVTVEPGAGIALSYEVIGVIGNVAIPPYTRRYILAPRQDQNVGI